MRTSTILLLVGACLSAGCRSRLFLRVKRTLDPIQAARQAEVETYPWPDHVTGEERIRIEAALESIFDVGGREGREAEAWLVELDRDVDAASMRMAGRLVSEMKRVIDAYGLEGYEGKSRIMVLDRMLRKLDGVQERVLGEVQGLDIDDSAARALRLVKGWNWWYREGRFQQRYAPWDPRIDMLDQLEGE